MSNLVPLEDGLKQIASKVWYWPVVRGALTLAFGLLTLLWPVSAGLAIILVIGIYALVEGVVELVEAIRYRAAGGFAVRLVLALLSLAFGLVLVLAPVRSAVALVWVIGLWAVVAGLVNTVVALAARQVPGSGWGWMAASALLTLLFGVLVLVNVAAGVLAILWLIGAYALVLGILLIALGLQIRAVGKRL
ncbi:MAG: DUF308 domain-containing protein [Cellulomonas sp.]|nr:DUF308 domain-containing protein [Cellulomonas sp.]